MIRRFFTMTILLMLVAASPVMAGMDVSLVKADDSKISISNPYGDLWEYSENGESWSLNCSDNGKVVFRKGYGTLAEGKFKGSKLQLNTVNNDFFIRLKIKSDKIKISWSKSDDFWELKQKSDKVKVKRNDIEYGKIKFYPETGKLKAKDRFGETVVEIKKIEKLTAAPGAFLMTDLSKDQQVFMAILLFAKNR